MSIIVNRHYFQIPNVSNLLVLDFNFDGEKLFVINYFDNSKQEWNAE